MGIATPPDTKALVPSCRTHLKTAIWTYFEAKASRQWRCSSAGGDLHLTLPQFSRDLRWTKELSRLDVALVSQFVSGHYPTAVYLQCFGLLATTACQWCQVPVDDRAHRLFDCPRFTVVRQQLSSLVDADTHGRHGWMWGCLLGPGRRYLARFLWSVRAASSSSSSSS